MYGKKEKALQRAKKYYEDHKEECKKKMKKYNKVYHKRNAERERKYRREHKEELRAWQFKNSYGVSLEQIDKILLGQNHQCPICGEPLRDGGASGRHIDHDHKTNRIRGILCSRCNLGLGLFRDNSKFLANAAKYLEN